MRSPSFRRWLSSSFVGVLALAAGCPVGEGEGEGDEGEGEAGEGEGEGEEGEGEGGEGEGEGERAFGLVWWNVANDDVDPRIIVGGSHSRAELLPAVTLALDGIVDDIASVEFTDADGVVVVDNAAPFRFDEDAAGNAVAGDYGVGNYAFHLVVRDAAGVELGRESVAFGITADGLDATPDSGAHARHDFWIADGDVRVHRDDNGDYVDDNGAVVVDGDSVSAEDRGSGQTFLVSSGGTQLRFAYSVLLPDGFSSTVRYPLVVLLHHGFESYRGTDLDNILFDQPPLNGGRSIVNGPQRHNFPAVVLVPQLEFHETRDGVNHEWAAFTGIDGGTGNCTSAPDYSEGGAFARGVVADLVAGDLVVDGAVVNVDADRLILTGHSMGGLGTWDFIGREPALWAAAVPMAGFPDFARADALVDTRIWAFHHRIDCFNTFNGTNTMHDRIVAAGGTKMEFTALDFDTGGACDQAHFQTPDRAFSDEALLPWMFSQVRGR